MNKNLYLHNVHNYGTLADFSLVSAFKILNSSNDRIIDNTARVC